MDYTFDNIKSFRSETEIAKITREQVHRGRRTAEEIIREDSTSSSGFLAFIMAQTGLGKTYEVAAFILDQLIEIAKTSYVKNINDAIKALKALCSSVVDIKGLETAKPNLAKIAATLLKSIKKQKLWNNEKSTYRLFMADLVDKSLDIKNLIIELVVEDTVNNHVINLHTKIKQIAERKIEHKPIVVITDTGDNVLGFYNELRNIINTDNRLTDFQRSFLKSQILHLIANPDQISEVFDCTVAPLINKHFSEYEKLNSIFENCKKRKGQMEKFKDPITKDDFKQSCSDLHRELHNASRSMQKKCKKENKKVDRDITTALIKIFPATRFINNDVCVLFMTTHKYLKSITHETGRFNFQHEYNKHTLIIDEIDKQESVIAKEIIKGRAYKLISGFRKSHTAVTSYKLRNSPRYDGVEEIIQPAINELIEVAKSEYLPEYNWDIDNNLTSKDPVQLFSATANLSALVVNGKLRNKKKSGDTIIDWVDAKPATEKDTVHLITSEELKLDLNKTKNIKASDFPKVIENMGSAYLFFLKCLKKAAYKILKNEKDIDPKRATLRGAIESLIKYYELSGISNDIWDYITKTTSKRMRPDVTPLIDNGFHTSGFNYKKITRENASEDCVEFESYNLPVSATGLLMGIVTSGAEVIGISATANARTVLHNFDYNGLKQGLNKRFIEMTPDQKQRINKAYQEKRNYKGHGIKLNVKFLSSNQLELINLFDGNINSMESAIKATFDEEPEQSAIDNRIEQLSRLLQAICKFTQDKNSRYMLCLCSRGIGNNQAEKKIIDKALKKYAGENELPELFTCMNAEAMRQGEFEKALKHLSVSATSKVIILSPYKSFGSGKNPQYEPTDKEDINNLINVDDTWLNPPITADIDCLYLDLPTSLFPTGDEKGKYMDTITRLFLMYYTMCLKESGVINSRQAKTFILQALESTLKNKKFRLFRGAYASKNNGHMNFDSRDYIAAVIKYIEQAVGRIARSPYKRKNIYIYASSSLAEILNEDRRSSDLLSHEYLALRAEAKIYIEKIYIEKIDVTKDSINLTLPTESQKLRNAAYDANIKIHDVIMKQVRDINNDKRYLDQQFIQKSTCPVAETLEATAKDLDKIHLVSYEVIINFLLDKNKLEVKSANNILASFINKTKEAQKNDCDVIDIKKIIITNLNIKASQMRKKVEEDNIKKQDFSETIVKKWVGLRQFVLKNPTLTSLDILPYYLQGAYIKIPEEFQNQEQPAYKYKGYPDKNGIRKYEFFDGFDKSKRVSAEEASLVHITSNAVVQKHFEDNGYAIDWKSGEYMLAPVMFTNIYRPAVSEQACEILLNKYFNLELMLKGLEEKFDAILVDRKTGKKALIDFKFWQMANHLKPGTGFKIKKVIEITGINRVIYINMLAFEGESDVYYTNEDSKLTTDVSKENVMVIPGLMSHNNAEIIPERINQIRKFINN